VGQAAFAVPALVAQARLIGGLAAWQWGAYALGTIYLAPPLLALLFGSMLGTSIVSPGFPDGWEPSGRGALIGGLSLAAWLGMVTLLVQSLAAFWPTGSGETPPEAFEAAGYILLTVPFVLAAGVGACAGFLLHAVRPRGSMGSAADVGQAHEVDSRRTA
jgi:hypothetical protein